MPPIRRRTSQRAWPRASVRRAAPERRPPGPQRDRRRGRVRHGRLSSGATLFCPGRGRRDRRARQGTARAARPSARGRRRRGGQVAARERLDRRRTLFTWTLPAKQSPPSAGPPSARSACPEPPMWLSRITLSRVSQRLSSRFGSNAMPYSVLSRTTLPSTMLSGPRRSGSRYRLYKDHVSVRGTRRHMAPCERGRQNSRNGTDEGDIHGGRKLIKIQVSRRTQRYRAPQEECIYRDTREKQPIFSPCAHRLFSLSSFVLRDNRLLRFVLFIVAILGL